MSDDMKIDPSRHYPTSTAAQLLGVSASTVRDLERRGRLTCTRTPGGQRRFAGTDLLRLQDESSAVPQRELPPDSAGEIRLRFADDIERALSAFGPAAAVGDLAPLVRGLVEQA